MKATFAGIYDGLTVLVTGHTGFKGSWLALWLRELGANVIGYSLEPPTQPSNFEITGLQNQITHVIGDILDLKKLQTVIAEHRPQIIFHLAAQAIVLDSYEHPRHTFEVNSTGTINVIEAARLCPAVKALVMITTDKCYENREWVWGYCEKDALGGNDPYSASKAMAELAIASYRKSFFNTTGPALASARAGNVIGGGDFSAHRIVPDSMKALLAGQPIQVRNPNSVRPWLNVLDPLSGYLWLGACLLKYGHTYAQAWNFGPLEQRGIPVQALVEKAIALWGEGSWHCAEKQLPKPEMGLLRLNWDKVAHTLCWQPVYNWEEAIAETVDWFKAYRTKADMYEICRQHIQNYNDQAAEKNLPWALLEATSLVQG
jgi:CDP-glucose 4,6-dehydratase